MNLVDIIVGRIIHWSTKLLSYVGNVQLIKSVTFSIANYWMQCFLIPKYVIHKIKSICRSFLWICGSIISRKSLISWDSVCRPRDYGGLNIIDLTLWNKITMLKLLWNLSGKSNSMWVRIHTYYLKYDDLVTIGIKINTSWIVKAILKQRGLIVMLPHVWNQMLTKIKFRKKDVYKEICSDGAKVTWTRLFHCNSTRLGSLMTL